MQVRTYTTQDSDAENLVLAAFHEGCPEDKVLTTLNDYAPSDVAVVMGVFKKNVPRSFLRGKVIEEQRKRGLTTVILETGYINRGDGPDNHYAAGLNGLNGRADFKNANSPADRAQGIRLQDWQEGSHIILCGQVPWDASVDFTDHKAWLEKTARAIFLRTDRPVIFRPHPKCKLPPISGTTYSTRPLSEDLKGAFACVTFNSNSGVEAALAGVPVFAFDEGSMCWPIANKTLDKIDEPDKPDRQQWLNDLCYAQWTPKEMKEGKAWAHLFSST